MNPDIVISWTWRGASNMRSAVGCGTEATLVSGFTAAICTYKREKSLQRILASIGRQSRRPDELLIVDASPDDRSENVVRRFASEGLALSPVITYLRVGGALRGLTRQRNLALTYVKTDLVGFYDDDLDLDPECFREAEILHHSGGAAVAGVGAFDELGCQPPTAVWRIRQKLGIVRDLTPGRYDESGMSIPWSFLPLADTTYEGDWLPGAGTIWKTDVARRLGFWNQLTGYALSEDLEFSLRARSHGRLLMAGKARFKHFHDPSGRPDPYRFGYMEIFNRYLIHQRFVANRNWMTSFRFLYAWTMDTILLLREVRMKDRAPFTLSRIAGRVRAAVHLIWLKPAGASLPL